jgi:hypothetical protein
MREQKRNVTWVEIKTILLTGLIAVLIGGGAGVYFPLVMGKSISADSVATYVFAVLAPFWIDVLLPEQYWSKLSKSTHMQVGFGCVIAGLFAIFALLRDGKTGDITLAVLATVIVLVVWFWLAVLSERYKPEVQTQPKPPGGPNPSPEDLAGGGL